MIPIEISGADVLKFLGAVVATVIGYLIKRELSRVGADLENKADKDHMQREIEVVTMKLEETKSALKDTQTALRENQAARDRDFERMERANSEKFAEFTASIRNQITSMERNMNGSISSMKDDVKDRLDMILKVMDGLRKE